MSDVTIATPAAPRKGRPDAYQGARDVRARAAVATGKDTPALIKALDRLEKVLGSGRPLNTEVPRGHYLNVRV